MTVTSWVEGELRQRLLVLLHELTFTSAILNPLSPMYRSLKETWNQEYEDNYWAEDAIFMERNSRDFVSRAERVNTNAEAICELFQKDSRGKSCVICTV